MGYSKGKCKICNVEAKSSCTGCFLVYYCSPSCQKEDWAGHKTSCSKPYKVDTDKVAGRVMVAARDLEPGDVILKEKAALVGPNIDSGSKPVCLVCFASTQVKYVLCSVCSAPLCSVVCSKSPLHQEECRILKTNPDGLYSVVKNGTVVKRKRTPSNANYQIILVLRALLLKRNDVKKFKSVTALQSHVEEREELGKLEVVREKILPVLHQFKLQDAYEDLVQQLCGIFDTNCFELFPSGSGDTISGVFPAAAMMMHSCYKNTRLMFSDDHILTLIARTKVRKGDRLYHAYARTLTPTNIRRIGLFSGKHFSCECVRCKDPTELGTYTSAFACKECSKKGQLLAADPLDLTEEAVWCCNKCDITVPALKMAGEERTLMMEKGRIQREDVEGMEMFVDKHSPTLHHNHAFLLETKKELSVAYGNYPGFEMKKLSDVRLKKKIEYCQQLISVLEVLEPGLSTQKGLTLYELWKGREEQLSRAKKSNKISFDQYTSAAKKNISLLQQSVSIMEFEPENSLHGSVAEQIRERIEK